MNTEQGLLDFEKLQDEFIKLSNEVMLRAKNDDEITLKIIEQNLLNTQQIEILGNVFSEFAEGYMGKLKEEENYNKQIMEQLTNLVKVTSALIAKTDVLSEEIAKLKRQN